MLYFFTKYFQAKSGKELVGFLFNDFLLLAQPQKPLGNMNSVFSLDTRTSVKFKMYRTVSGLWFFMTLSTRG